jgi:exodeoxyribonuclease X
VEAMKLFVIDTETSDLDPSKGATILELAWMELTPQNMGWELTGYSRSYIEYSGPVSPHAQASHHIRSDQLTRERGAISREDAIGWLLKSIEVDSILVAHNVDFDSKFLPELARPWICTFRAAKHAWPEAPGYSNQVLRYWLNVDPTAPEILKLAPIVAHMSPHQALYDVATTTGILLKMLERYTPEQLLWLTKSPVQLKSINFGKHKGTEFKDIPKDYLKWLRGQSNLDPDVKATIDSILR